MTENVYVAGVGMTEFGKPGASESYDKLGEQAVRDALSDAGVSFDDIEQAYAGFVYEDTAAGQKVLYQVGLNGIPIINVNNACASGSSALFLARQAIASGQVDCALALGFEEMTPGALGVVFPEKPSPLGRFLEIVEANHPGASDVPMAVSLFGAAGHAYQQKTGIDDVVFAHVRAKASRHARDNERAIFRKELSADDVLQSPPLFLGLTRLQACPPTCGAAAALLVSEDFARRRGLNRDVRLCAQAMTTDGSESFAGDPVEAVGFSMAKRAATAVYEMAGIGPEDVDVVELHDCFTTNEVLTYEALGLCTADEIAGFVMDGKNTYGGKVVTNPSGGLLSKGHPLGATGLAQCAELVWQLRGEAGSRQVPGARIALQHNIGIGGACVVGLYERG